MKLIYMVVINCKAVLYTEDPHEAQKIFKKYLEDSENSDNYRCPQSEDHYVSIIEKDVEDPKYIDFETPEDFDLYIEKLNIFINQVFNQDID